MTKTIKQIADELKIDKQKVYRYIKKNHINEAHQKNGVMYYDDVAEMLIKQAFIQNITSNEVHQEVHQNHINEAVIDVLLKQSEMLQKEFEIKNKQIISLQEENRKLRGELMTLSGKMGDVLQNITKTQLADKILEGQEVQKEREEVGESRGFFSKIFGK